MVEHSRAGCTGVRTKLGEGIVVEWALGGSRYHTGILSVSPKRVRAAITRVPTTPSGGQSRGSA